MARPDLRSGARHRAEIHARCGRVAHGPTPDDTGRYVSRDRTTSHPRRLTFAAPGEAPSFIDSDADVAHLPGVRPIESDEKLSRAQHASQPVTLGREASWHYIAFRHPTGRSLIGGGTRVRIEGLFSVANLPSFRAIGQENVWDRDSDSAFWTSDPLVVVVRVPADALVLGGSQSRPVPVNPLGDGSGSPLPAGTLVGNVGIVAPPGTAPLPPGRQGAVAREWMTGCGVGTNELSERWELERTFTTVASQSHRSWPARVRKAVAARHIVLGMPRDAAAYVSAIPTRTGRSPK